MTKTECLKRIRDDEKIFEKINKAIDEYDAKKDYTWIAAAGAVNEIQAIMEVYERRGSGYVNSDFTDGDNRRLVAYLDTTTA